MQKPMCLQVQKLLAQWESKASILPILGAQLHTPHIALIHSANRSQLNEINTPHLLR
jgi:hypothetical protein